MQLRFSLFLLFDRVLLSARSPVLTFSSKGKSYLKRLGGKARGINISSLPGESPSHSPPTLCLGSHLLPVSHAPSLSSALPLFASPLFSSLLPSVCAGNYARKPGPMATPFSANSTCPVSRGSLGRQTPFVPPFGEEMLPQPPQKLPPGRRWVILANHC